MHTDPARWPAPERFDPARFLDPDGERGPLLSFGVGPRSCVGARFALRVLTLAIASVALALEWSASPGARAPSPSGRFPWSEKVRCPVRARLAEL